MKKLIAAALSLSLLITVIPMYGDAKTTAQPKMVIEYNKEGKLSNLQNAVPLKVGDQKTVVVDNVLENADSNKICGQIYKVDVAAGQNLFMNTENGVAADFDLYDAEGGRLYSDDSCSVFSATYKGNAYLSYISSKAVTIYLAATSENNYDEYILTAKTGRVFTDTVNDRYFNDNIYSFSPKESGEYTFTLNSTKVMGDMEIKNLNNPETEVVKKENYSPNGYVYNVTVTLNAGTRYGLILGSYGSAKYTLSLSAAPSAKKAVDLINAIGTVSTASQPAINAARSYYDSLIPAEKALVTNVSVLTAAESAYADTTKPDVAKVKVNKVISTKAETATVIYKKVSGAAGYEVTYSLKKNFKAKKIVKGTSSKNKVILKKLESNKTYFVKVRAYKNYLGQTYYGAYSKVQKVSVK